MEVPYSAEYSVPLTEYYTRQIDSAWSKRGKSGEEARRQVFNFR